MVRHASAAHVANCSSLEWGTMLHLGMLIELRSDFGSPDCCCSQACKQACHSNQAGVTLHSNGAMIALISESPHVEPLIFLDNKH